VQRPSLSDALKLQGRDGKEAGIVFSLIDSARNFSWFWFFFEKIVLK
tara:strand:- start:269 stop:409 length:141 start_codon:yes stop_codon:yes gene_type:complete